MNERYEMIMRMLRIHQYMTVQSLCEALGASPATVRRALTHLDDQGLLQYINGGALLLKPEVSGHPELHRQKKRIVRAAIKHVRPGDSLFLDAGSTNDYLADELIQLSDVQVVTNSIYIAYRLFSAAPNISVCVCGGSIGGRLHAVGSVVGELAESLVNHTRANIFFMGCSALSVEYGITDPSISAARIKQCMIENAQRTILLCDHTKFGQVHMAHVSPLGAIDHMITDTDGEPEKLASLETTGLSIEKV